MRTKKILSLILTVCIMLASAGIMPSRVEAATATLKVDCEELLEGRSNYLTVELSGNTNKIGGLQFFVQFDTDAFSVNSVTSLMSDTWEMDWKEKSNSQYGDGVLCMIQDVSLTGMTDSEKNIVTLNIGDKNAQAEQEYEFDITVIDVCDEAGNTIKSSVSSESSKFTCTAGPEINISNDVKIEGFQISYTLGGLRTISSVEPKINGKEVVEYGNIYAIARDGVVANDMYIGSKSNYVASYAATKAGILDYKFSDSETAVNYVRTMSNNGGTTEALTHNYMIRAYAKLSDGSYLYSEVSDYSIFAVAKLLYDNSLMHNFAGHEYLYNDILTIVDSGYGKVDYNWNNSIITP